MSEILNKLRKQNPAFSHYSDKHFIELISEQTGKPFESVASKVGYKLPEPEPVADMREPERPSGFTGMLGNVVRGAKQAGRNIGAMGNTITGDLTAVEDYARRSQESAEKEMPEEQRQLHSELQAIDREQGAMGQIGDTLGTAARNPMGTAQLITEQIPNSAVSLGSGWAGFKTGAALGAAAGPVGAGIGGTLGFLGGMFLGNYMLEGGSKAIEKAEGGFTEDERRETLTEGAKKAGVITAVDAATFKAGSMIANRLGGAAAVKNGAKAEAEVLMKAGVDMSSPATINAALAKSPELMKQAKIAGERAAINTLSRSKKAGIAGTGLSLETVGEGAGEYLGEMAATGEGDVVDATIEALAGFSQSAVQTAYNYNRLGNKLNPENIREQAEEINQARTQEGINNIASAETVDDAIQAAADTAAQKPVTPGDVMDDIAYREELLKRTEAFTQPQGAINEEEIQQEASQPVQTAEVLGQEPQLSQETASNKESLGVNGSQSPQRDDIDNKINEINNLISHLEKNESASVIPNIDQEMLNAARKYRDNLLQEKSEARGGDIVSEGAPSNNERTDDANIPSESTAFGNAASKNSSWVIVNKDSGEAVFETYDPNKVKNLNKEKYQAIPVHDYLTGLNSFTKSGLNNPSNIENGVDATLDRVTASAGNSSLSDTIKQNQPQPDNKRDTQERVGQITTDERLTPPVSKRKKKSADDLEYDSETIKRDLREISELNNIRFNENGLPGEKLISKIRNEKLRSFYSSQDGAKRLQQMVLFAGYKDPEIYDLPYSDNPDHRKVASTLASTGFLAEEMANEGEASIVPDIIDAVKSITGKEQKGLSDLSKGIKDFIESNDYRKSTQFLNGLFYAANSVTDTDSLPDTNTLLNEAVDYANNNKKDERLVPASKRAKNAVNDNNVDYNDRQSDSSDKIKDGEGGANQRKSSYNPNNLSLDLGTRNLELDYGEIEQRPGTTEKQREIGNRAFRDLVRSAQRMGGSLLAANIAKDFKEQAGSVLIGRTAETPQDLAILAQVLRDPRFETFRIFFVKNGRIVHHTGITSRLPGSVDVVIQEEGETAKQALARFLDNISNQMKASEADGYYLLHNHPSGRARASTADVKFTKQIAANLPGFKSHVIIDHNEYGEISIQELDDIQLADTKVHKAVLTGGYSEEASLPHNVLQATISNARELAGIGKHFEQSNEWFTLVGRSANGRVVSIAQMPMSALKKPDLWLLGALRRFARSSGAIRLMAVTEEQNLSRFENAVLNGVLLDVVSSDGSTSLRQRMQTARDDGLFGAGKRKAIQVKQDDMPADNILRSTQAEKAKSLSVEEVKQAINPLRARLLGSVKINVVQSTSDIPARVHERSVEDSIPADTDGVYDPAEKTVYLIADNIPSAERALWVALHETVGHAGLRALGKDVQQTITYASKNKFVADLGRAIAKDRQQDYDAIHHNEEAIAELSAALLSDNVDAILERYGVAVPKDARRNLDSIIQRVVEAIRRFVSNMMGKVTDQQIRDLVMAAKVAVEGGRIESGKAANDYMRESLRLIRNGYRTVNDFIIPETPEYADNITGDLAYVPENDSIPVGPLRVEVGKATGEHRGFGITHIADNARRDSSRMPKKESGDFSEDLIREAVAVMRGARAVHHDGAYVFVNPSMKKAIVASYRNGYYSVTSVRPYKDPVFLWGNSEWTGSLRLPSHESAVNSPSFTDAGASDTPHPDRIRQEVSREKFTIPESNEKGQDKKRPTVTTKKRRNIEEPKLSSSPSLSKMLEDYKSIYNEMMSDEFINNNDFDKWVELRERADSIRMEISNKLESGRANGIGIDGDSLLSRNTTDPKNPWRITYLTKDGEPNGHSEYKSAKAAVDDFLTLSRTKKEMVLFSRAQTLANAGVNTTTTQAGKASTTLPEETKFQAFRRKTQDAMLRFKLVQEWLNEQGVNLTEAANVYQRENISKGKTANLIENFRNKELEPLIKDIAEAKFELGDIATYLEARHIPEANARMRQIHNDPNATANGITDQQAQKVLADFQAMPNFKEFEKLAGRVWNIGQETLDMRLNAGLISQEQYDAYKNTYKNWVPLRGNVNPQGFGKGLSTSHKDKRRMGHGFREDEFVLENLVQDRERAIMQVEKNKVSLSVLEFLMQANNPEIGTVGKPQKHATIKDHSYAIEYKGQVVGSFENKGAADSAVLKILNGSSNLQLPGVASILPQDLKVVKTYDPRVVMMARPQLEDNEIQAMINGSAVRMQLNDPLLARAGTAAGIEQVGGILEAARAFNRFLSKAYTSLSPDFFLTNMFRDAYSGTLVLTGKQGGKFTAKVFKNYASSFRDLWKARKDPAKSQWVTRYRNAGGNIGAAWLSDLDRVGQDAMAALQRFAGARQTYNMVYSEQKANGASDKKARTMAILKAGKAKVSSLPVIGNLFEMVERVNAVIENTLRLATFRTAIESGLSDQQAAMLSKDLMNFNRKGEQTSQLGALYLFFNPAAQSAHITAEALFTSPHKKQVWALLSAMTALSFLLSEFGRGDDEDEWEKIPEYVKDRNLVFKYGDMQATIPVSYGWGFAHSFGRLVSDFLHGEDASKVAVKLAASFVDNFSPAGNPIDSGDSDTNISAFQLLPTIPKMVVGPSVNMNSFGNEIYPHKYNESMPDSQLASRGVRGTIYQDLADFLNDTTGGSKYEPGVVSISPNTIKYWVTSLAGGAGRFVSDIFTGAMDAASGVAPELENVPVARRFVRESGVKDSRSAFWKAKKEAQAAAERFNRAVKDGEIYYAQESFDKHGDLIALAKFADANAKMAASYRDAVLEIQLDKDMSKTEKKARIKELEMQEKVVYDEFLSVFRDVKK